MSKLWHTPHSRGHVYRAIRSAIALAVLTYGFSNALAAKPRSSDSPGGQVSVVPDPQLALVLRKMAAAGVLHPLTVAQVRKAYEFYSTLSGKPESVFRVTNRSIPGPGGNIAIRIYAPSDQTGLPVFVFFHGGAFVAGSLDTRDTPLRAVANRCGCIVVSVGYRLAPEHTYPAAPDDAYAATNWIANHAAEIGGDSTRIAVGGDGAGGNLAAVVSLMARDRGKPRLTYQVLIYPSLDALTLGSRYESKDPILDPEARAAVLGAYVPLTTNLQEPYISPIFATSLKGLPPAFLVTDADDPARDEGNLYAEKMASAGISVRVKPYPNMIHGFFLMAGELNVGKQSIDEISAALRTAFAPQSPSAPGIQQGESQ